MGRPDHYFNPSLAEAYGVDVAVFLHNIFHWVEYNEAHKKNFYEGRYWTYNSISAFCEVHPYWSKRQIERIATTCKKNGLLLTGCFNEDRRDRTMWYTLSDLAMRFFSDNSSPKTDDCISRNGEMQSPEPCQSFPQTVAPLPINKPDNKQKEPPKAPTGGKEPGKYDLAEDAKPVLQAYVGEDGELHRALADLIEIRVAKKAINSRRAILTLLRELDRLSEGRRVDKLLLIRQSVSNSWKSVFPLRQGGSQRPEPSQPTLVAREEVATW